MKPSELIKKEVAKIDSKINRHKDQIRKLENQKFDLLCNLHNEEFEETEVLEEAEEAEEEKDEDDFDFDEDFLNSI